MYKMIRPPVMEQEMFTVPRPRTFLEMIGVKKVIDPDITFFGRQTLSDMIIKCDHEIIGKQDIEIDGVFYYGVFAVEEVPEGTLCCLDYFVK